MNEKELLCRMALPLLPGIGLVGARHLIQAAGSATMLFEHARELPALLPGVTPKVATAFQHTEVFRLCEAELSFAQKHQIQCLTEDDEAYPSRLRECPDGPLVLFYKGSANLNNRHILSIVGTRNATDYGKVLCQRFMQELSTLIPDVLIVSGLAYGIDIHAHREALTHGFDTVGVLAHGLDRIYPAVHRRTATEMLTQGGLLTEFMSGTNADKANFVMRNRIVAGMADATVLVESAARGGGLITAGIARSYNREVLAYPGAVGAPYSEGCNRLIRDNAAVLVTSAADVAETLGWATQAHAEAARRAGIARQLFPELTDEEQAVARLLQQSNDMQLNTMAAQTRMPVARLAALLFQMEMKGLVRPLAGGAYHWID